MAKNNVEVKKRQGENVGSLVFRFNKRVKQSGVLKEVKKRRFSGRTVNRGKRRLAALYRLKKQKEIMRLKKYGFEGKAK